MMTYIIGFLWLFLCAPIVLFAHIGFDETIRFEYSLMVQIVAPIAAAGCCYVTSRAFPRGDIMRTVWVLLGSGVLAWGFGAILFALYPWLNQGQETPYPWYSDIGYLCLVPLILLALSLFKQHLQIKAPPWGILAALVIGVAALALAVQFNLSKLLESESLAEYTVTLLYVLGDPLLLGATVAVASVLGGGPLGRPWWFVVIGLVLYYFADVAYTYLVIEEQYQTGSPIDVGWPLGFGFIAVAALMTRSMFKEL